MNINFSIENAVKKRYSVRNYQEKDIETSKKKDMESFINSITNPLGGKVHFLYLDNKNITNKEKLGTYGVIKGATEYIGTTIHLEPMALESVGYELETVMLYLAHLNIGTCWLGGTFDREAFADAMNIKEGEVFPIITPYGYAAPTKHEKEVEMRKIVEADHRKEWDQLFFKNNFQSPLTKEDAGVLLFPLEMVRLAPSASNKQPWRILVKDNVCHFYEYKEPGYSDRFPYDIQRIDIGIAAAHFDLSVKEKQIKGHFDTTSQPSIEAPQQMEYVFSWIMD